MTYRKRSRIIALGASLILPGGGHFYTGRTKRAFTLVAAFVVSMVVAFAGAISESLVAAAGIALLIGVIGYDLIGTQRFITSNLSRRRGV